MAIPTSTVPSNHLAVYRKQATLVRARPIIISRCPTEIVNDSVKKIGGRVNNGN